MTTPARLAILVTLLAVIAGCKPKPVEEQPPLLTPPPADGTRSTLQLDPSDPIRIAGWWDNGRYLLEVGYDYGYRILDGPFPESQAIEKGRWTQENHFTFTLEPYDTDKASQEQVVLSKDRGRPVATIEGLAPFRKLSAAPISGRDLLLGSWSDGRNTLIVRPDASCLLRTAGEAGRPGLWSIEFLKSISWVQGAQNYELGALVVEFDESDGMPWLLTIRRNLDAAFGFELRDGEAVYRRVTRTP